MNLTKSKLLSIGKGALIAAGGAALTYLGQWAASADLGQLGPVIAAVLAIGINAIHQVAKPADPVPLTPTK